MPTPGGGSILRRGEGGRGGSWYLATGFSDSNVRGKRLTEIWAQSSTGPQVARGKLVMFPLAQPIRDRKFFSGDERRRLRGMRVMGFRTAERGDDDAFAIEQQNSQVRRAPCLQ